MDIRFAIILTIGLIVAAFLHGGLYAPVPVGGTSYANAYAIVNRLTGGVTYCEAAWCGSTWWAVWPHPDKAFLPAK